MLRPPPSRDDGPPAQLADELHRHQLALARQTRELLDAQAALDELVPVPYVTFDAQGTIAALNPAAATMLGRTRAALVGTPFVGQVELADPDAFWHHLRSCAATAAPVVSDLALVIGGTARRLRAITVAVTIAVDGGGATALRTAFVELADRDHAAPAGPAMAPPLLGEAPGGARRAGDDLVAVVSHDLRSPLSAITLSVAHLLRASPPDERRASRKQVEVIQRAAEHMTRLIDDLLIATTLQAGRLAVDLHPTRLDQLVADALTILEPAARARAIELVAEVRASRPEACCDRERIHQVVANLVHNAIRFTPEGGRITIVIEAHGAELWTSVVDGGPGIPAEELPDLFHRYQQGATRAGSGVGLGLYICQGIVAHHGGRIWAEPGPAGGAAFSFSLPAVPPAP